MIGSACSALSVCPQLVAFSLWSGVSTCEPANLKPQASGLPSIEGLPLPAVPAVLAWHARQRGERTTGGIVVAWVPSPAIDAAGRGVLANDFVFLLGE